MAIFSDAQIVEIDRKIAEQASNQSATFGTFLRDGAAQVEQCRDLLGTHNQELQDSAARVTQVVERAIVKEAELEKLRVDVTAFAAQQNELLCYALQLSDNGFDLLKSAGDTFPVVCASADRLLLIQAASMEDERNLDTAGAAPKR